MAPFMLNLAMTEKEFLPQVIQAKLGNASWTYGFLNCIQTPEVSKSSSHLFFGGHGTRRGSCRFCPLCTHGGHLQRNRQSRNARKCILEYYGSGKIMQHDFSKFISKYLQVSTLGQGDRKLHKRINSNARTRMPASRCFRWRPWLLFGVVFFASL